MEIRRIEEKCNQCMLCVKDCVAGVFREINGLPVVAEPSMCNRCGHCVAVCPKNAIEHDALDFAQVRRLKKQLPDPDIFKEIIRGRRSVRHYKDKPVSLKDLEKIIDLARYSPTASNSQHVEYIIITDKKLIEKLSSTIFSFSSRLYDKTRSPMAGVFIKAFKKTAPGMSLGKYMDGMDYYQSQAAKGRDFILHNAPALILVLAPAKASFACDNCNIAAANITNYAHCLGLGTCYVGFLIMALRYSRKLRAIAGIPKGKKAFASLVIGHPAYKYTSTTSRKKPNVRWIKET